MTSGIPFSLRRAERRPLSTGKWTELQFGPRSAIAARERIEMKIRTSSLAIGIAFVLDACGGSSTPSTTNTSGGPGKVASLASEVPSSVTGPVQIATDATYAPNEFIDPNTGAISGWDIDLGLAICKVCLLYTSPSPRD